MARRKFSLTPAEVADISNALESASGDPAYDRLRAILAYSSGAPWREVAARYHCSRESLQHWRSTYRRLGKEVLVSRRRRGGRDTRLMQYQLADLARRLTATTPAQAFESTETFGGDRWTAKDLYRAIQLWYGVIYKSPTTYYQLLKRLLPPDESASSED